MKLNISEINYLSSLLRQWKHSVVEGQPAQENHYFLMSSVFSFVHFLSQICTTFAVKISKQTYCEMTKFNASNKIKEQLLT